MAFPAIPKEPFFADLYHAPQENYWGYITNGGTEANMYGLHVGRSVLEANNQGCQPIVYYSEDTHFSVRKIVGLLRFESCVIPSDQDGKIRVDELLTTILANDPQTHPPLLILNLGTSFKGAYDDVEAVVAQLAAHGVTQYYIHVDAALGGLFLPFLEGQIDEPLPLFDFRLPIGSIAVSGHKCIGAPFPCGVVLTLRQHMQCTDYRQIEYIGSPDTTLSCSRNGLAPMLLWYAIAKNGRAGLSKLALHMLEMADFAMDVFTQAGYHPRKNKLGLSVVFDRPPQWVVEKWSLSTQGDFAHVFTMGHINKNKLESLAADLRFVKQEADGTEIVVALPLPSLRAKAAAVSALGNVSGGIDIGTGVIRITDKAHRASLVEGKLRSEKLSVPDETLPDETMLSREAIPCLDIAML